MDRGGLRQRQMASGGRRRRRRRHPPSPSLRLSSGKWRPRGAEAENTLQKLPLKLQTACHRVLGTLNIYFSWPANLKAVFLLTFYALRCASLNETDTVETHEIGHRGHKLEPFLTLSRVILRFWIYDPCTEKHRFVICGRNMAEIWPKYGEFPLFFCLCWLGSNWKFKSSTERD